MEFEVIALGPADAERAEAGGATRLEIVGDMSADGFSPALGVVESIRQATSLPIRVMLRLRAGFGTDGGEVTRLLGMSAAFEGAGANGLVLGFLNGLSQVDLEVMDALVPEISLPWTFHRAIDATFDTDRAWTDVLRLGCDQVLTAGSARGVSEGLDSLVARAQRDPEARSRMLIGGGLHTDHVPWLMRAGVRGFHVGSSVRPNGSYRAYVETALVKMWRRLLDQELRRAQESPV